MDGKIIPYSFDESLKLGLYNNVPFMIGNMGQETDQYPNKIVTGYSQEEWKQLLESTFTSWDNNNQHKKIIKTGDEMYEIYRQDSLENPQKAFDSIVSDYGLGCASIILSRNSLPPSGNYSSKIYVYVNQWNLSLAFAQSPNYHVHYAFHLLDLVMLTEDWSSLGNGSYIPQESDLKAKRSLQSIWYNFLTTGIPMISSTDGSEEVIKWYPIDYNEQWPLVYNTFVLKNNTSENVLNYRSNICEYFNKIELDHKKFWWSN